MLLSYKYNFIFVKTKKVGGTSFEIAVSKHLGKDDIITPCSELTMFGNIRRFEEFTEEDVRSDIGALSPQNYKGSRISEFIAASKQLYNFCNRSLHRQKNKYLGNPYHERLKLKRRYKYEQHMRIGELKEKIPKHIFDNFLKITIVRDPLSQTLSDFYDSSHRPETENFSDFDDYMKRRNKVFFQKNWDKFTINNKLEIDKVIRYENFLEDIGYFCKKVGLPADEVISDMKRINIHSSANFSKKKKPSLNENHKRLIKRNAKKIYDSFYNHKANDEFFIKK